LDDSFCGGNDGMEIYEADWHRDHAKKEEYLRGLHLAEDALSGKNGISLLFSTVYDRNHSRWTANGGFRSKREIQREHLLIDWLLSRFISPKS